MKFSVCLCFFFISSLLLHSMANNNNNAAADCESLLQFSNSFTVSEGDAVVSEECASFNPKTKSWKNGTDCCKWDGVECDAKTNRVTGLDLSCSGLQGPLHSNNALFSLLGLRRLNLAFNDFNGSPISPHFGDFTGLTHLKLSYCGFSGPVPVSSIFPRLHDLVTLDLSGNNDELTIEDGRFGFLVRNLTRIREFNLESVKMPNVPPISLTNLSSTLKTLILSDCDLRGMFPTSIFHFPNLQTLTLYWNYNLTGTLPRATNWTSPLVSLDLWLTMFHGPIPASLGNLTSMESLVLADCGFTGIVDFEQTFKRLDNLRTLNLGGNFLTVLMQSNGNCSFPELQHLSLIGCGLTELPYFLSSSRKLEALYLRDNTIGGRISDLFPSLICGLSSLRLLKLQNNKLDGTIPGCLGNLSSLFQLDLGNNLLEGPLPWSLANWTSLGVLYLDSNRLDGVIESSLPPQLSILILSNNSFFGQLPVNFLLNSSINYLGMSENNFDGSLPILPPTIRYLFLSNNKFHGSISRQICNAIRPTIIDLSNNQLTGTIPRCFEKFVNNSLTILDLRANGFTGQIPDIFSPKGNALQRMRLSQNQLGGTLPQSLARCEYLEILDLGENALEGRFPNWLDALPNLQVLSLRSNKFHGPIYSSSGTHRPFPKLRIFDICKNGLSGPLPAKYLAELVAMKIKEKSGFEYMTHYGIYQDSITIDMKGLRMELEKISNMFMTIDFSCNSFEGEIPEVIGDLKALKGLNFSHNNLSGSIPSSFGNLTNLEWLDLSSNKLGGKIPKGLSDLTMLAWLNLSSNQLTGPVPHSTQFDTFNYAFDGNPGLCGRPLTKPCESGDASRTHSSTSSHKEEEETQSDNIVIEWKAAPLGYVCGLVVGISTMYLMLETGRPRWLARMVERKIHSIKTNRRRINAGSRNHARRHVGG